MTWPSGQGWQAWWTHVMTDEVGLGQTLEEAEDARHGFADSDDLTLVSGQHLRPGAIYHWIPPEGFARGRAGGGIGGRTGRRDVFAEYHESADPQRRVELHLDSLESCRSLSATSTLKHLAVTAGFRPERDQLLDVEITLDWLLLRLRARVVPAEAGEQLRVSLRVVGRGLWKPVVAPLLVPLSIPLRHLLTSETEQVADRLSHLDEDPRGDGAPERELERIRVGAELIRTRLHEVVSAVDARPWWTGRGTRALAEAFDALPAVGAAWPPVTPAVTFGDSGRWWDEEKWIFDLLVSSDPWRRRRHEMVDQQVDLWLSQQQTMIEHREQMAAKHAADEVPTGDVAATAAELEEMLDLSWLASPWSMIRFLARKATEESPDPDLPPLETDEDARTFVTSMLKDL
ncbi:hypothetical protein FNH13_03700 [Ornithinimicrobium ciconiae]|uniref:Uncharacterized protein n=1 Tax=Ornithinimicrobium ciconiae TaxID=2594265 RepID=A0A516G7U5_9MICO|nr:hypothetical protein [Ornithinimicrobium ciconiae]QDO87552.1 hypothetical protein FNH13_03700 [Ornithinimicrobium ciconiae]